MSRIPIDGELDVAIATVQARLRELDGEREVAARELAALRDRRERAILAGAGCRILRE